MTRLLIDCYFDSETAKLIRREVLLEVSEHTGLIHRLCDTDDVGQQPVIDLRGLTVLPGFVDTHVHFFLHPYTETSWEDQLAKESLVERTVRATNHARNTLLAGFTTVRDLGTEGAGDADVALRECISTKALIPGPRYLIANRALVPSGSYGPRSTLFPQQEGIETVLGAQVVDGPDACIRAVRKQVGAGADWIKIYGDYSARARMASVAPRIGSQSVPLFNQEELAAMINSARRLGVKVACHANDNGVISTLARLGVNSIEHGCNMTRKELELLADNKVAWNPTLAAYFSHPQAGDRWAQAQKAFKEGLSISNLKIACGGDTGVFSHGDNSLELKLMMRLGAPWERVIQAATLGGWECVRSSHWEGESGQLRFREIHLLKEDRRTVGENEMPFGILCPGFSADIIATRGNLQTDFESAVDSSNIVFVMKAGRIYKCPT